MPGQAPSTNRVNSRLKTPFGDPRAMLIAASSSVTTSLLLPTSDMSADVEFLTERISTDRNNRSRSCTLGLSAEPEDLFEDEVIDLTCDDLDIARHHLLDDGEFALEKCRAANYFIQAGSCLEAKEFFLGKYRIDFILVRIIVRCRSTGQIKIRGTPLARNRRLLGKLPKKPNEVCMILHFNDKNNSTNGLVDICPTTVIRPRNLVLTNAIWPQHCSSSESGNLTCRWKLEVTFTIQGNQAKPQEQAIVRLQADDALVQYRISEELLCNQWRGSRTRGGSWTPSQGHQADFIDLDEITKPQSLRSCGQQYTVFDSYSGAGGVSRGAKMAGFRVQYAVDKSDEV
ncbi:hypothetical protein G7046_g7608 [Stylonectria norvegica]|nr:hypothetical protein G7046_g7608 [Stylonectria norvegica]